MPVTEIECHAARTLALATETAAHGTRPEIPVTETSSVATAQQGVATAQGEDATLRGAERTVTWIEAPVHGAVAAELRSPAARSSPVATVHDHPATRQREPAPVSPSISSMGSSPTEVPEPARQPWVIVGGVAARAHGSARLTDDLDVSYARAPANLARVIAALAPLHPYLRGAPPGLPFRWSVATLRAGLNFTLTTTAGAIDLLGEITGGGPYEALLPHTLTVTIFGRETRLLDLPWLIRVKRAAGRPKDLEVIAELEALQEERR